MEFKSLREWLEILREDGILKTVNRPVKLVHELAAVAKKADGKYCVFFEDVSGTAMPIVAGIASSRKMFARALGVSVDELVETFSTAQSNPGDYIMVERESAPVKEVIEPEVDLHKLPIPTHHEKDGGPYITAGVLVSRDPSTGIRNLSIHRLQVLEKNRLGILILPRHLWQFLRKAEAAKQPLEVAISIGLDPILMLSSQAITPFGVDEYMIAGALYRKPLELVKCETVDLEVPAHAEIVLEGTILPDVREIEGPFGEYPKYYSPASLKPVLSVSAITRRKEPIYQTIVPATMEHMLLGAIPREGGMLQVIRSAVPNAVGVHLTPGGTCRYHVVVSIDKLNEGEPKNAMFAAFSSSQEIKRVVVVDKDVDIFDPVDVEWAIATRFQAASDTMIVQRAMGNKLDPSSDGGISDKMGIDATIPLGADPFRFERIRIPGENSVRLEDYIDKPQT
jgi:2,5-furandicarboxylate decarboxylase 1